MVFQQVLYRDLGCASYFLGDAGEAVVVDPRYDIDVYLELAREHGLTITHVIDTHDHADHVSGRERLAEATGATTHRAARAGDSRPGDIEPGTVLRAGAATLEVLGTPGHRPEHVALVLTDESRSPEPWAVLTGDSLFVGSIARPDLAVDMHDGARDLYASMQTLLELGDHVEVWPGHVGGSLCGGGSMSKKTSSTIGYERRADSLLSLGEEEFVAAMTTGIAAKPPNVAAIVAVNRTAAPAPAPTPALDAAGLRAALDGGAIVLDVRPSPVFDQGHLPSAINLVAGGAGLGTRAGWALTPGQPVVVVAESLDAARVAVGKLQAVALTDIAGIALEWAGAGERSEAWDVPRLARGLEADETLLVDVRDDDEWAAGHVDGSVHVPLPRLGDGSDVQLPGVNCHTIAVACAGGGRAAFAASLLRRNGWSRVVRVGPGGIPDLVAYGVSLSR